MQAFSIIKCFIFILFFIVYKKFFLFFDNIIYQLHRKLYLLFLLMLPDLLKSVLLTKLEGLGDYEERGILFYIYKGGLIY
jgi:hypothetical protein